MPANEMRVGDAPLEQSVLTCLLGWSLPLLLLLLGM
jgi:hypothetical protein